MTKKNKKIKNQLLQSIKKSGYREVLVGNKKNTNDNQVNSSDSTDSYFPIDQRDLLKVFVNTLLIILILVGFYYFQSKSNYPAEYTEKFRALLHF